jgi:ankyrin repeat protein
MNLGDMSVFPIEIFATIIEQVWNEDEHTELDTNLTLQLRLVCRLFDHEIRRVVCRTEMFNDDHRKLQRRAGNTIFKEYFALKVLSSEKPNRPWWSRNIQNIINIITRDTGEDQHEKANMVRRLCDLMVDIGKEREEGYPPFLMYEPMRFQNTTSLQGNLLMQATLAAAAALNMKEVVKKLLVDGVRCGDNFIGFPIECAARIGDTELVNEFLSMSPTRTELVHAIAAATVTGKQDLVILLLNNLNQIKDNIEHTRHIEQMARVYLVAVRRAAFHGRSNLLPYLVSRYKDDDLPLVPRDSVNYELLNRWDSKDPMTDAILVEASAGGHVEIVRSALAQGANSMAALLYGKNSYAHVGALELAVRNNHDPVVQELLKSRKHDWKPQQLSKTLLEAARKGFIGVAKTLVQFGADPNYLIEKQFKKSRTCHAMDTSSPLIEAMIANQVGMIQWLVDNGAKLELLPNKEISVTTGQLMLDYALTNRLTSMRDLLAAASIEPADTTVLKVMFSGDDAPPSEGESVQSIDDSEHSDEEDDSDEEETDEDDE